jgi:hypothetical protein
VQYVWWAKWVSTEEIFLMRRYSRLALGALTLTLVPFVFAQNSRHLPIATNTAGMTFFDASPSGKYTVVKIKDKLRTRIDLREQKTRRTIQTKVYAPTGALIYMTRYFTGKHGTGYYTWRTDATGTTLVPSGGSTSDGQILTGY